MTRSIPPPPTISRRAGYAAAVGLTATALAAQLLLRPYTYAVPFGLFFPVVLVATYVAGRGPGAVSAVLATAAGYALFIGPTHGFGTTTGTIVTGFFALFAAGGVAVAAALRRGYEAHAREERRFRSLVTATAQVLWTATPEGMVVEDSPSWRAVTGQSLAQGLGLGWLESVHPDDRARVEATCREGFAAGEPFEAEFRLRRADGTVALMLGRATPVRDDRGRVVEWVGATSDVSAQRRAEEELRETEDRFRTLVENIPQMVFTATPAGEIDFSNPQYRAYTGLSLDELAGGRWAELFHPDDRARAAAEWERMIATGEAATGEFRLRRADGAYRWFLVSGVPLRARDGRVRKWFGTCTDIEPQKRSERRMADAIAARDVFLSVASHELKTPITAALLQLQQILRLLARGEPVAVEARAAAAVASVERLARLVDTLLDTSRIATGQLALQRNELDLSAVLGDVVSQFSELARRAGGEIEADIDPDVRILGDRMRVEQVAANLVSNAVKYGGGRPIAVSLRREGATAVVRVADRGIGIAPEDQTRIFDRFERATSERHYGGLGLGLWLTRQIVEAIGGAIGVESAPGRGATFTVALPAAPAAVEDGASRISGG